MRAPLLNITEAAEYTQTSVNTLRFLRANGRGPKAGKLGRRLVFRKSDLDAWIDAAFEPEAAS